MVKPLGLVTQPNHIGAYPLGAMSQAVDAIMRAPGTLQQAYAKTGVWAVSPSGSRQYLAHGTPFQMLAIGRSGVTWDAYWWDPTLTSPTPTVGTLPYSTDGYSDSGRMQAIAMRGRTIVNAETRAPIVADYENPTSAAERTFRSCGFNQPSMQWNQFFPSANPSALGVDKAVTYAFIVKRTFADGYVVQSRPCAPMVVANSTVVTVNVEMICRIFLSGAVAGDTVELYRSQAIPYVAGTYVDPGFTLYKVQEHIITAGEFAAGDVFLVDSALASNVGDPLAGLGEPLYTNPGRGGAAVTINDPPPAALCLANFRGRAWYGNLKFYGRTNLAIRRPFGGLTTDDERANGIGQRFFTATLTSGNATLTTISASHILGLAVGQRVSGVGITNGSSIVSVGATSIVISLVATANGAQSLQSNDMIEIDSNTIFVTSIQLTSSVRKTVNKSLFSPNQGTTKGIEILITRDRYIPPATLSVRATHGEFYDPPLPLIAATAQVFQPTTQLNGLMYSLDQQPEAVPPANELQIGVGEIYAMVPTRDALWIFCSDGLYRLTGTIFRVDGIPDIRVDPIDAKLILAGPRAWCVLRDQIFAYTNRGLVVVSNDGVTEISTSIIGDLIPGQRWTEAETPYLVADDRVDEVYIMGAHASLNFVYALRYGIFTTTSQFGSSVFGIQLPSTRALIFGYNSSAYDELQPDLTALLATGTWDFQPAFGDGPDRVKQWIDATYICEPGSSGTMVSRVNGAAGASEVLRSTGNALDLRANIGIGRDAPAIAPCISVGVSIAANTLKKLSAISLRYSPLTEQHDKR